MDRLSPSLGSSRERSSHQMSLDEEEGPPNVRKTLSDPRQQKPTAPVLGKAPVMQRASSTLHHAPAMKPRLDRLNAGKVGSRSLNYTADFDSEDCTFLFLPGPQNTEDLDKPWEEPGRAEQHEELLKRLPDIHRKAKGKSVKQRMEAATMLRELAQGSPETIKTVSDAGTFSVLSFLMESEDPAVVEETVMAIYHFAQHKDTSKRLIGHGIMAALSLAFTKAAERQPRPHFSIQSNICAAYLQLSGGSFKSLGSAIIFAGSSMLRHILRLARPDSGCNSDGRRDALKLMLLLTERGDVRGKLIDYGAVGVAIENVEAEDTELFQELGALFHAFSKMDEAGQQLCGLQPLTNKLDRAGSGSFGSPSQGSIAGNPLEVSQSSLSRSEAQALGTPASPHTPSRRNGSRKSGWNIPDIAENEVLSFEAELQEEEAPVSCRGLAAIVQLLDLNGTHLTQDLALSVVTRLVTRGVIPMTIAVKEQPGMMEALERLIDGGSTRGRKKAHALFETLGKVTKESLLEGLSGLPKERAKSCGSVPAY